MKRYALVGASSRCLSMFAGPLAKDFKDVAEIVGIYDINFKRSEVFRKNTGLDFPVFIDFNEMLNSTKPDIVIVTTVDGFHHEYIIKSLYAGCDVITEKPMTIDEEKCNAILDAEKKTGRKVTVTFNVRFMPFVTRMKELIKEGHLGKILGINLQWMLDTEHGADYFRRWHRQKKNSGGLLVHKSTHHFDMVNWLIEQDPEIINAFGTTSYYGPTRENRGERCLTCSHKESCNFYFNIEANEKVKELYLQCEDVDGYIRDGCIFSSEIDIEDTVSVSVKYSGGAVMSYSLTAHSPYEGFKLAINGSEGRIEAEYYHGAIGPFAGKSLYKLRLYNRKGEEIIYNIPTPEGDHGGGDVRLQKMLFKGYSEDPLGHMADTKAGAMSIIIGAAANISIREGKSVYVKDLLRSELIK
jgi:predicted dehydrogenase